MINNIKILDKIIIFLLNLKRNKQTEAPAIS